MSYRKQMNAVLNINKLSFVTVVSLAITLLICQGCSSIINRDYGEGENNSLIIKTPTLPQDDERYSPVLSRWQKGSEIYKETDLNFQGYFVLMSPEMTQAYKKRFAEIRGSNEKIETSIIGDNKSIAVVANVFIRNRILSEIDEQKLWSIQLSIAGQNLSPFIVKHYRKKEFLAPYFPPASQWTRFYVMLFKLTQGTVEDVFTTTGKNQSPKDPILFSMNSGETQVKVTWDKR